MNFIPVFFREERYFYSTGQSDIFQTVQPTANSLRKKGSFLSLCCLSVFIFIPLSSYSFTFPRKIVKRKSQRLLRVSRRKKKETNHDLSFVPCKVSKIDSIKIQTTEYKIIQVSNITIYDIILRFKLLYLNK